MKNVKKQKKTLRKRKNVTKIKKRKNVFNMYDLVKAHPLQPRNAN